MFAALAENLLLFFCERPALNLFLCSDGVVSLAFPLVAQTFVEHQRHDIILVVLPGGFAEKDIGCAPKVRFKLLLREFHAKEQTGSRLG